LQIYNPNTQQIIIRLLNH